MRVDVIGANCSVGPAGTYHAIRRMVAAWRESCDDDSCLVSVMPNAGFPARIGERYLYLSSPQYFAEYTQKFVGELGVTMIGGCCGTTPAHTAAMRDALNALAPATEPRVIVVEKPAPRPPEEPGIEMTHVARNLRDKLNAGRWVTSVELDPPRGLNPTKVINGAAMLQQIGVDAVNIADSPLAKLRMGCISLAVMIQQQLNLETIIHFTTRDRNLMALQSELIGAHALGIHNVLALTGDPPRLGDYPNSKAL
jgi:homocysteine S-methyltransferase